MKSKTKLKIIGWTVAFMMALGCIGLLASILCFPTIFSLKYAKSVAEEIGYVDAAVDRIHEQFVHLAMPSDDPEEANIPLEVLEGFFAEFDMRPDVIAAIETAYGKGNFDTSAMESALGRHILRYAEDKLVDHYDEVAEGLAETTSFFAEEYTMVCNNALLEYFGFYRSGIVRFLQYACIFCGLLFLLGLGFQFWLFFKNDKSTFFLMLYGAFCPSALIFLPIGIYLGASDFLFRLSLRPIFVRDFIAHMGSGFFYDILYAGIVLMVLSAVCYLLYRFIGVRENTLRQDEKIPCE